LLLVGSRTASLRPAPLLPFVPTSSEDEVDARAARSIVADLVVSDVAANRALASQAMPGSEAVFRPPFGDGSVASVRRPSVRERVAPPSSATCVWIVSIHRFPGWVCRLRGHLAVIR